ncbi:MAG TPA: dihydroxy-acid dehydratase, partial [Elusimicrobiota bacterium]|nr:dihydroxy-acid dehydratase [Elusimicrobiota bacterium]
PIAAIQNGDRIRIDVKKRTLTLDIPAAELKKRLRKWKAPAPRYRSGVMAKYAAGVSSAALGAVTN